MNKKLKLYLTTSLPFLAAALSLVLYFAIPESGKQKQMPHPYYIAFLLAAVIALAVCLIAGLFAKDFGAKYAASSGLRKSFFSKTWSSHLDF